MKMKKLQATIVCIVIALSLILGQKQAYAANEDFWVDIFEMRQATQTGYIIGDLDEGSSANIWELIAYSGEQSLTEVDKNLYCTNARVGETWQDMSVITDPSQFAKRVNYKLGYNLKTEKSEIEALAQTEYKNIVGANYHKILWVIDNMYIPDKSDQAISTKDRNSLLKASGILGTTEYSRNPISDDDIKVIQQLVLWYFTNPDDPTVHPEEGSNTDIIENLLRIKNSDLTNGEYKVLSEVHISDNYTYGTDKVTQMNILYNYFKDGAEENYSKYGTSNTLANPISISDGDALTISEIDSNYNKVGPINITKNNDLPYTLNVKVTNGAGTEIPASNISYINSNGQTIDINNLSFTNNNATVYVKVPKTVGSNIKVNIDINYRTADATLWIPGLNGKIEQPIVDAKRHPESVLVELSTEQKGPFDLALRKFITKINGSSEGLETRIPTFGDWEFDNGNTIVKSHDKTPLKVAQNDIVLYTIRIYNEGEIDGTATKIVDYLPEGLVFIENSTINTANGWTNPSGDGKTLITDILKDETISAREGTANPSYKDVQIECKVVATSSSQGLKNIAEIIETYNEDGTPDRDSTPDNLTPTQKSSYNPETATQGKGYEDDDDFENLQLEKFDLALRKFITAISKDATIEENEKLTGTVSREPVVTYVNGKLVYTHPKDALSVKSGDYVLYTIRVYNEGEVDGYASLIRDNIPEGLTFVATDATYNGIWTLQNDGSITTDNLAKGKGEELDTVEGDAKYKANLLRALQKEGNGNVTISTTEGSLNPDYRDVQVLLQVAESNDSNRVLDNRAQIADDSDENGNPIEDIDSTPDVWEDEPRDDDQDHDPVKLQIFDLALRKFISSVDGKEPTVSRDPNGNIDASKLADGTAKTAIYNHPKTPLEVAKDSKIVYTIRAYNEGDVAGFASEIVDYIPEYLEVIPASESTINSTYGWTPDDGSNDRVWRTSYLAPAESHIQETNWTDPNLIPARQGETLRYREVKIECRIKDTATQVQKITNIAEISGYKDENGTVVNPDRDSTSKNVTKPSDADLPGYKDTEINRGDTYIPGQEDDDDFEKIIVVRKVDLALTKFITAISSDATIEDGEYLTKDGKEGSKENPYLRQTAVDTTALKAGTATDATYTQVKTPLVIANNTYVLYNIRVYNEGEVDVFAGEVTDYLPENLEFVDGNVINEFYNWSISEDGRTVTTKFLSHGYSIGRFPVDDQPHELDALLKAFDKENDNGAGSGLDYKDLPILCKVSSKAQSGKELINTAEITKYEDKDGNDITKDIDSEPDNKQNKNDKIREEDDDDFEVIVIKKVDLALTKFITAISSDATIDEGEYLTKDKTSVKAGTSENPYDRQTKVDTTPLKQGEHDAKYEQVKEPALNVNRGSYVLYNIRVYNEGQVDVYAGEVTDYLPDELEFIDGDFNKAYGWKADGQTVKTEYLSYKANSERAESEEARILKAFDSANDDGAGSKLDFKDLPILCRVRQNTESGKKLVNIAEVTKYEDENGDQLPEDIDSTPDNVDEKNEDDDDYETVIVEEFDLNLIKFVSQVQVTEDGKTRTINTGNVGNNETDIIPKVEINKKKLNSTVVKFIYTIRVSNEGDIAGYAKEITDYVPEGLKFVQADNPQWTAKGDEIIRTRQLEDTLLQPGESATVTVVFTWINGSENLGLKHNIAEISEDYNEKGVPDRDSTPNNKVEGEDDIDYADVLLSIKTGKAVTYILLSGTVLIILASGIILIKKYVL